MCEAGKRGDLLLDAPSGNVSVRSGSASIAKNVGVEIYTCDLGTMACTWEEAVSWQVGRASFALPRLDSGFTRVRVAGEKATAVVTRHGMLSLDVELDCKSFDSWPTAAAACGQLLRGTAPSAKREQWVMILALPSLQPSQRFFFIGVAGGLC